LFALKAGLDWLCEDAPAKAPTPCNTKQLRLTLAPRTMALQIDTIRATADRVAASHHLAIVDVEFSGGAKFRTLRVFLEKDATARAEYARLAAANEPTHSFGGVPVETLSCVTHEDCANFARDFGTVLDVEDIVPGAEYTLEVSSPGLERKLLLPADYERFRGSLVKLSTFTPIADNRHFSGRLTAFDGTRLTLDLTAVKQNAKARKSQTAHTVEIELANVEKANLVAEI
jgi:ribosome maturation factor RimP